MGRSQVRRSNGIINACVDANTGDRAGRIQEMKEIEEKTIWIIRYADGYMETHYGTRAEAEALAEERCVLHLNDYIIA